MTVGVTIIVNICGTKQFYRKINYSWELGHETQETNK